MAKQTEKSDDGKAPLFRLDLGANGGEFAPYTVQELQDWVKAEVSFWSWVESTRAGAHRSVLDSLIVNLNKAREDASAVVSDPSGNKTSRLGDLQNRLRSSLVAGNLPHSSSALGQEVEALRQRSPLAAVAFLFPQLKEQQGLRFEPNSPPDAWHGFLMGLFRKYGTPLGAEQIDGQRKTFDKLLLDSQSLIAARRAEFDQVAHDSEQALARTTSQTKEHASQFELFLENASTEQSKALEAHRAEMEALRKAFREEMALRGPVEYWQSRHEHHGERANAFTTFTFAGLTCLGLLLGLMGAWAVRTSANPFLPDLWRLVMLGFVAAIGIWAVRLVVRLLLSHMHLATDAAERVTMVKTYLALIEADKLPKDDDRKMILQALFRPGSDGMVKDEGLPHPALEFLTRSR